MYKLPIFILLLTFSRLNAQNNTLLDDLIALGKKETAIHLLSGAGTYPAEIFTHDSLRISGFIEMKEDESTVHLQLAVRFIDKAGKQTIYTPKDIKGFVFYSNGESLEFETMDNTIGVEIVTEEAGYNRTVYPVRATKLFMIKVVQGYFTLYYIRKVQHTTDIKDPVTAQNQILLSHRVVTPYPTNGFVVPVSTSRDHFCIKKENGQLIMLYKSDFAKYFIDNIGVYNKIKYGTYNYYDLPTIVTQYNQWKERLSFIEQRY